MAWLLGEQQQCRGPDVATATTAPAAATATAAAEVAELAEPGEVAARVGSAATGTLAAVSVGSEGVLVVVLGVLVMGVNRMPPVVGRGGSGHGGAVRDQRCRRCVSDALTIYR